MREVAWVHRPVTVTTGPRRGTIRVANRRSFSELDDLRADWQLRVDGVVVASGRLAVPSIAPHGSMAITIPSAASAALRGSGPARADLSVHWTQRRATAWAPAGHLVAWDQVTLRADPVRRRRPRSVGRAVATPAVVEQLLAMPATLNVWRAATDNDGFKLMPELAERMQVDGSALGRWRFAGLDTGSAQDLVEHRVDRTVDATGAVTYAHIVEVPEALIDLPRVGVMLALPAGFETVRWFGRGPHENYPDRRGGAELGIWEGGVDASPYLVPQEFGLRTDVRWMELGAADGRIVRIDVIGNPMHAFATHHTPADLFAATHELDLVPRPELIVCLDSAHRGLGTASCGPDVLPRYRLGAGTFRFAYRLSLLRSTR